MLIITQTALELGFLYALVAMALFLSYRTLDIADMTTDGCFVLGAAVSVTLAAAGHPFLAIPAAMAAGACAGYVTAFLQTRLGVPSILAGIVTNTGLYTVNLMAMGWKSNASLLRVDTIFSLLKKTQVFGDWYELVPAAGVTILAAILLRLFLGVAGSGLSIRATGDNRDMVRASSLNPAFTISVGLSVSNALTALSGAIVGQYQKTVDINSGTGIVVIGLACLIIGETVLGKRLVTKGIIAAIVGSILYRFLYAVVFYTRIVPVDCLKLLTAAVVALAIAAPTIKKYLALKKRMLTRREDGKNAWPEKCIEDLQSRLSRCKARARRPFASSGSRRFCYDRRLERCRQIHAVQRDRRQLFRRYGLDFARRARYYVYARA